MKTFLSLVLLGVASLISQAQTNVPPAVASDPLVLPDAALLDNSEYLQRHVLESDAAKLIQAQDYAGLEAAAAKARQLGRPWGDGMLAVTHFYSALAELGDDAPPSAWKDRLDRLQLWKANFPHSLAAQVTLGRFFKAYAWRARGSDWASSVGADQWKAFFQHLKEGADVLSDASTDDSHSPERLYPLLPIAQGLQAKPEDYQRLMDAICARDPLGAELWHGAAYYFLPRWYGTPGQSQELAAHYADKVGGVDGDGLYARWAFYHFPYLDDTTTFDGFSWPRIRRGMAGICQHYPHSALAANMFCYLAVRTGDRDTARQLFAQLGNHAADEFTADPAPMTVESVWDEQSYLDSSKKWALGN